MKNILVFSVFTILLFHYAQAQQVIPLWPEGVPNYQDRGEVEKADTSDIIRISLVQNPSIEVYLPAKKNATGQAMLICPGGGYHILAYGYEGQDVAKFLNGHGIAGIVLKYRLPDAKSNIVPHKSPLMDAKQAMKIVKANAEKWNINPDEIGVMGFSAGGHLASTLGTHFDEASRPDFMALIYPVITFDEKYTHGGSRDNLLGKEKSDELINYYSNEKQVKENTPPTFIVHSGDDKAVPVINSLLFYQALNEKNIPTEMHIYPYGGHGYSLAIGNGQLSDWPGRLVHWLQNLNKD